MARLVSPPVGLGPRTMTPLSGPRAVGASGNTSIGNYMQTVASPFGGWRWQFTYEASKGQSFRKYRGWITSLHGGANATRMPFFDPDMMSLQDAGVVGVFPQVRFTSPWANGLGWSNGKNWSMSAPNVPVAEAAAFDTSRIKLSNVFWGHRLDVGDYLGFFPLHFGLYMVTQVFDDGDYRIWPPLRKALTTGSFATLYPTLAMRLEGEEAATASRGVVCADEKTVTLVEVFDYDARDYFAD